MNQFPGHEQFPDKPVLPLVTEDTVDRHQPWKINIASANQMLIKEQPVLASAIGAWSRSVKRDASEWRLLTGVGLSVYYMLKLQAEADGLQALVDDRPEDYNLELPLITEDAIKAHDEKATAVVETAGSLPHPTYRRLLVEQPALAAEIEEHVSLSRDELEAEHRLTMAETVYEVLEWQAATNRFNEQLNTGL
jgi:hypothetical protein